MNDRSFEGLVGVAIVAFLLGGVVGWLIKPCPCTGGSTQIVHETEVVIDTVEIVTAQPPIYITGPGRVVHDTVTQRDTIIQTRPFVASLDTIVDRDTVGVTFRYPASTFSVLLRQAPDTSQIESTTFYITKTHIVERAWWVDALTHVGAATLGYSVGRITN